MFYAFEEIHWRRCRQNTVPLSDIRSNLSDGVTPSPKGRGAEPAHPPSKFATAGGDIRRTGPQGLTIQYVLILLNIIFFKYYKPQI